MRFDGVELAKELESKLMAKVEAMDRKPKLVIFMVNGNESSEKYVAMKKEAALRVGIEVQVREVRSGDELKIELEKVKGERVDGVMVQMPIGNLSRSQTEEILKLIPLELDVDGLNPENIQLLESGEQSFIPATVKAVEKILDYAYSQLERDIDESMKVAVVGSKGMVGSGLCTRLKRFGVNLGEFDEGDSLESLKEYGVVISCVGKAGLIGKDLVSKGAICIDVGFPKGDFEEGLEGVADFWTPVPGGVGPLTVVSLLENVVYGY